MSLSFDRAVEYYDRTRSVPPGIVKQAISTLIDETGIQHDSRILEVGIGTGRIAIPLAETGHIVNGIDLSLKMMHTLQAKTASTSLDFELAQADATNLPFPSETFNLIYAVHVLHLVAEWRTAVTEAFRTLKREGYFVLSWHRRVPDSPHILLRNELHRLVAQYGVNYRRPGAQSEGEILTELRNWDHHPKEIHVADWYKAETPAAIIEEFDHQIYSETWAMPREILDNVLPQLADWAKAQFGNLDRQLNSANSFTWLVAQKKLGADFTPPQFQKFKTTARCRLFSLPLH